MFGLHDLQRCWNTDGSNQHIQVAGSAEDNDKACRQSWAFLGHVIHHDRIVKAFGSTRRQNKKVEQFLRTSHIVDP